MPRVAPPPATAVVVVEPYGSHKGHYARSLTDAADALALVVDRVVAVGDRSPLVSPGLRRASRSVSVGAMRALGGLRAGLVRFGGPTRIEGPMVAWCGRRREMVRALGDELPVLWAARRAGHRLRQQGYRPVVLVTSSFLRPHWLKPALVGFPTAEQVFEPCRERERPPLGRWHPRLATTSAAVAATVETCVAGSRVTRLAHFPLSANTDPAPEARVAGDLRGALEPWRLEGRRWGLVFGTGHVKKDLAVVLDAVDRLDDHVGLALVGRLGAALGPEVRHRLEGSRRCVVVDRYVTEVERRWLFDQAGAAVLCDRAGTVSVSGSLLDAVAAGCPIVAPRETASGRLVEAGSLGVLYRPGDAAGLARAVERALRASEPLAPDRRVLADEGLLPASAWARAVLALTTD